MGKFMQHILEFLKDSGNIKKKCLLFFFFRLSAPPLHLTPERIPLQNTSNFTSANTGRFLKPPGNCNNSPLVNGNGLSPTSTGASNSSSSPTNTKNGSPRRVFVTIHENEERVTTRLVRTGSPNLHESITNGSKHDEVTTST